MFMCYNENTNVECIEKKALIYEYSLMHSER